jgi:hypothetical protein
VEMGLRRVGHPERSEIGKSAQRGKAMVLAPEGTRLVDPDSSHETHHGTGRGTGKIVPKYIVL